MAAIEVKPVVEPILMAHPVTLANATDVLDLMARAQLSPRWSARPEPIPLDDDSIGWRVYFTRKDLAGPQNPLVAQPYSVVIEYGDLNLSVCDPVTAAATYHADVELAWAATVSAPTLTVQSDGTGAVVVRQPTSLNGPWDYHVALTDHTDSATTELTPEPALSVVKSPGPNVGGLILGADITLPLTDLTVGHEYSATITVACRDYEHTATSLPSATVTVPEPEPPDEGDGDEPAS